MTAKKAKKPAPSKAAPANATNVEYVYVLRCCDARMRSYGGFVWPESGMVECPDWQPHAECGNGLHGWLWGEGDVSASGSVHEQTDARWLVVRVLASDVIKLDGKIKYPRGEVVYVGTREAASTEIQRLGATGAVIGARKVADSGSGAVVGSYGAVSGGDGSTVSGGVRSTVSGGDGSTVSGGVRSTVSGGVRSTVSGGVRSTVSGGDGSTVSGGVRSILAIQWWDGKRYRLAVGYVGENGIEANVAYVVRDGKFARRDPS